MSLGPIALLAANYPPDSPARERARILIAMTKRHALLTRKPTFPAADREALDEERTDAMVDFALAIGRDLFLSLPQEAILALTLTLAEDPTEVHRE